MTMKNAVENFQKVAMNSGLTLKEGKKAVLDYTKVVCSSTYSQSATPLDFQGQFAQMWCDK